VIRTVAGRILKTVCIALVGFLILSRAYHTFANFVAASDYQARSGEEDASWIRSEFEKAGDYNRKLAEQGVQNFALAGEEDGNAKEGSAGADQSDEYEALLNVGNDGVMGVLTIPAIGVRLPIYHGVTDRTMSKGCGHLQGTSLPVGGDGTHAVLFGHRGLPDAKLFTDLDRVKEGDRFTVSVLGKELWYRVISRKVILPDETGDLAVRSGRDLVTLVTCTPYGINTHRLLVCGERTDGPDSPGRIAGRRNPAENLYAFFLKPPVVYGTAACDLILSAVLLRRIWGGKPEQSKKQMNDSGKEDAGPGQ
jgi:sortase A